jgi:VIT1/CCC1 family predicted Fe2+/Mn2+ transporter
MEKLHPKTEEGVLVMTALLVLVSSMLNATISIVLALASLSVFFAYNWMTKKQ